MASECGRYIDTGWTVPHLESFLFCYPVGAEEFFLPDLLIYYMLEHHEEELMGILQEPDTLNHYGITIK